MLVLSFRAPGRVFGHFTDFPLGHSFRVLQLVTATLIPAADLYMNSLRKLELVRMSETGFRRVPFLRVAPAHTVSSSTRRRVYAIPGQRTQHARRRRPSTLCVMPMPQPLTRRPPCSAGTGKDSKQKVRLNPAAMAARRAADTSHHTA